MEADNGAAPNAGTWLEWAQTWLDGHGAGDWTVTGYGPLGEARIAHGEGVAAVLQLQGADPITRMLGLLVCSDPWPSQDELDQRLGEEMGAYMGTLLANSQRLMALSFGAVIAGDGHGQQQTEVLRRMTLAMARDVRVVMVRLASALQSLRHVAGSSLPDDMMVPLAHGRMPGHEARGPNPVDDGAAVPANVLGLGNAATPLGLRAMREMAARAPQKNAATDSMAMFVVINTAAFQLIPTTTAAIRLKFGSASPFDILPCAWLSSLVSLAVGIGFAWVLAGRKRRDG